MVSYVWRGGRGAFGDAGQWVSGLVPGALGFEQGIAQFVSGGTVLGSGVALEVQVSGPALTIEAALRFADLADDGAVTIDAGGQVTADATGYAALVVASTAAAASLTVDGAGSMLTAGNTRVGVSGTGILTVSGGATLSASGALAGNAALNIGSGGAGFLAVHGAGSAVFSLAGGMWIGDATPGAATVDGGGQLQALDAATGLYVGADAAGTLFVDGTSAAGVRSFAYSAGQFSIGGFAAGSATVADGAALRGDGGLVLGISAAGTLLLRGAGIAQSTRVIVGAGADGLISLESGGTLSASDEIDLAQSLGATGTLAARGTLTSVSGAGLFVGYAGAGQVSLAAGAVLSVGTGQVGIGLQGGATGTVSVDGAGSVLSSQSDVVVGVAGSGGLTLTRGGSLTVSGALVLGGDALGVGRATADAATVDVSGVIVAGETGTGVFGISDAARVSGGGVLTGKVLGGSGTITVAGGTLLSSSTLVAGFAGGGTIAVSAGGVAGAQSGIIAGGLAGSSGVFTVDGAASLLSTPNSLLVGDEGAGVLLLTGQGAAAAGSLFVGYLAGSSGYVSAAAGTTLYAANGIDIAHAGAGTLAIAGQTLGAPALNIGAAGTLEGYGAVAGQVSLAGTVLAAGGTLTLAGGINLAGMEAGSLVVSGGGTLDLAGHNAVFNVAVDGVLRVDGALYAANGASGTGMVAIAPGTLNGAGLLESGIVELGSADVAVSVGFTPSAAGSYEMLVLDAPGRFVGTVSGFGARDAIDLKGVQATDAVISGGSLVVSYAGAVVDRIAVAGIGAGDVFTVTPDGTGGSVIRDAGAGLGAGAIAVTFAPVAVGVLPGDVATQTNENAAIDQAVRAAAASWAPYLGGYGAVPIAFSIAGPGTDAYFAAHPLAIAYTASGQTMADPFVTALGGARLFDTAAQAAMLGYPASGAAYSIVLNAADAAQFWTGAAVGGLAAGLTAGTDVLDLASIIRHELGHALGLDGSNGAGTTDLYRASIATMSQAAAVRGLRFAVGTTGGTNIDGGAAALAVGNLLPVAQFTGLHAEAVAGHAVGVTGATDGQSGAGVFSHVADYRDLMYPYAQNDAVVGVSALDLAMLQDSGVPVRPGSYAVNWAGIANAAAAAFLFQGGARDLSLAASWGGAVPGAGDTARFASSGTLSGAATVAEADFAGGTWQVGGTLTAGSGGINIGIAGGVLSSGTADLAVLPGGTLVAGAVLQVSGSLQIAGGLVSAQGFAVVGQAGTLNGMAAAGDGEIDVTTGGTLLVSGQAGGPPGLVLGLDAGSTGSLLVSGTLSTVSSELGWVFGGDGDSIARIAQGATIMAMAAQTGVAATVAASAGDSSIVTVRDAGSTFAAIGDLVIGSLGDGQFSVQNQATLAVKSDGTRAAQGLVIGAMAGSSGDLAVTDSLTVATVAGTLVAGLAGLGSLSVRAGAHLHATAWVSGGTTFDPSLTIGAASGADGSWVTVTGAGSTLAVDGAVTDGGAAAASLSVSNGGHLDAMSLEVGQGGGGTGLVSVVGSGSRVALAGGMVIGAAAAAGLSVFSGGSVSAGDVTLGLSAGGSGNVDLEGTGSRLAVANDLTVGVGGSGVVTVGQGATLSVVNNLNLGANGVLNILGGTIDPASGTITGATTISSNGVLQYTSTLTLKGQIAVQSGGGTLELAHVTGNGTLVVGTNGTMVLRDGTGDGAGPLFVGASVPSILFSDVNGTLDIGDLAGLTNGVVINGFASGDRIVVGTAFAAENFANGTLTLYGDVGQADPVGALVFGGTHTLADLAGAVTAAPCFAAGTRIATARGMVAVEDLRVGEAVCSAFGGTAPVVWIGSRRVECARHARPRDVWPVRIAPGAFAPGVPGRALFLSPDHAVHVGGVLVPVRYLLNGASIAQVRAASVTYFHVELPAHDVLLAEGLAAESYLDTGNRGAFGGGAVALHADFARGVWEAGGCAPLVTEGAGLAALRARLRERAVLLGYRLADDPGLRWRLDGRALAFAPVLRLPEGARRLVLESRVFRPGEVSDSADLRDLGVGVTALLLDGAAGWGRAGAGWHGGEAAMRWTDGAGTIDVRGVRTVEVALWEGAGRYWMAA